MFGVSKILIHLPIRLFFRNFTIFRGAARKAMGQPKGNSRFATTPATFANGRLSEVGIKGGKRKQAENRIEKDRISTQLFFYVGNNLWGNNNTKTTHHDHNPEKNTDKTYRKNTHPHVAGNTTKTFPTRIFPQRATSCYMRNAPSLSRKRKFGKFEQSFLGHY